MTWFRKRKKAPVQQPRERESAVALAASRAKLHSEREQIVIPMRNLIEQNNVTELVRDLMRKKGGRGGHGTAAG